MPIQGNTSTTSAVCLYSLLASWESHVWINTGWRCLKIFNRISSTEMLIHGNTSTTSANQLYYWPWGNEFIRMLWFLAGTGVTYMPNLNNITNYCKLGNFRVKLNSWEKCLCWKIFVGRTGCKNILTTTNTCTFEHVGYVHGKRNRAWGLWDCWIWRSLNKCVVFEATMSTRKYVNTGHASCHCPLSRWWPFPPPCSQEQSPAKELLPITTL